MKWECGICFNKISFLYIVFFFNPLRLTVSKSQQVQQILLTQVMLDWQINAYIGLSGYNST